MKEIRQGIEHKQHREIIKRVVKELDAEEVIKRGNSKGGYFPDARKDNVDFEVEMLCKHLKLKDKANRWDPSRSKVLILAVENETLDLFDKVLLMDKGGNLIELK